MILTWNLDQLPNLKRKTKEGQKSLMITSWWLNISVNLRIKFQVSSIILTIFRHGVILPPISNRIPKEPTQIRVKVKKEKLKVFKATNKKNYHFSFLKYNFYASLLSFIKTALQ